MLSKNAQHDILMMYIALVVLLLIAVGVVLNKMGVF